MNRIGKSFFIAGLLLQGAIGCGGGGGGGGSGVVLEGTLIQGAGSSHGRSSPKHSEGQPIGEVEICALGKCSTTDAAGQWGFFLEGAFPGGDVAFTVKGHGIDTATRVSVPAAVGNAFVAFVNEAGTVTAERIVFDGVEQTHGSEDGHGEHHE